MELPVIQIPHEVQTTSMLLSALLALAGLLLWSAGVKVARAISTVFCGLLAAAACGLFIPGPSGVPPPLCAALGLVAGLVVGAVAFDVMQAIILSVSAAALSAVALYQIQPPAQALTLPASVSISANPLSNPDLVRAAFHAGVDIWKGIPLDLRQRMMVLGAGVAILGFAIALAFPRRTTWVFTAAAGAGMVAAGLYMVAQLSNPALLAHLPAPTTLLGVLGAFTLIGMLLQHTLFWPGRRKKLERAKDVGHPVPA